MDRYGCKVSIVLGSTFALLGGIMRFPAQGAGMFIAFRFFVRLRSNAYIPGVYSSELAPPALRASFGGSNGLVILMGYSLSSYMGLAFLHATDPAVQ